MIDSPAADRNAPHILAVLRAHLPQRGSVLEIAAGSGQHAVAFSSALPGLRWTPADPSVEARHSIDARRAAAGLQTLEPAVDLDAADPATWPSDVFDAVVCINMIHISPWAATEGLMAGTAGVLKTGGLLVLYGPYLEAKVETAASNIAFDQSLKSRNPEWGLRDRAVVSALARSHGLAPTLRLEMPANNVLLLFRRA